MITVLILVEAFTKPTPSGEATFNPNDECSVWIVPGHIGGGDIDDFLARDGIRVAERIPSQEAERCAEDIRKKFKKAGLEAMKEMLCND